jgi:methylated-DNA-[protein]-cysteine S-methyltransferase
MGSSEAASLLQTAREALEREQTGVTILTWPNTPLGPLWAELEKGRIASLNWGKPPAHVVAPWDETAKTLHALLANYFKKPNHSFDWSIFNPKGTPFQRKVWQALCDIPPGTTMTYGALAKKLKSSARAVGGAVGSNPVPILIPCHRVMGAGGALTGFSAPGGLKTKKWLLAHEGIKTE